MGLFFYIFAGFLILGSIGVVGSKNSVHSVLWLIFTFCNASGLFVLLGAEFLAMTLVIVYVGAVAVLFLFIVMMLGNQFSSQAQQRSKSGKILGFVVFVILLFDLALVALASTTNEEASYGYYPQHASTTNTHAIGAILYTDFMLPFQISGVILFVAMIGSIVIAYDPKSRKKLQNPKEQNDHNKENCIILSDAQFHDGIKDIKYD
jgi:NADH-quinone oxidoreductase subunit J